MLFGVVFLSHQLGSFTGLWLAGDLYDLTKSYDTMWWISIALGLFAAADALADPGAAGGAAGAQPA